MAENQTRWWEFYAVRYAMGTVVGAAALMFLCSKTQEIQSVLPGIRPPEAGSLETPRIFLTAAYGLIYCYVASAPILVFHAGRFLLNPDTPKRRTGSLTLLYSILPVLCVIGACCASFHYQVEGKFFICLTAYAFALLLELEVATVYFSIVRSQALFDFYDVLDKRRHESRNGEIVESYRHLREHGNSFFIVFLEMALAVVLFEIQKLLPSCLVAASWLGLLIVWIGPAVCIWLVGTLFERRFRDAQPKM
ncbi:MAG TPA: hypothetical protein VMB19_08950 [Silvibacterium sp.]|nr:hypothetical protein [Silvibacterium sp.]